MISRRILGAVNAAACILTGLVHLLTLLQRTDPVEGLLLTGSSLLHYLLLAAPLLLAAVSSLTIPVNTAHRIGSGVDLPAFCGLLFSGVVGAALFFLQKASVWELAAALLMAIGCLWFAARILHGDDTSLFTAIVAVLGWLVVCVFLFSTKTASLHHLVPVLELLCCTGILLFVCGRARAAYSHGSPRISRMLFFRGMMAFHLGFCLLLPQELWQWSHGMTARFLTGKSIAAALLGVTGLLCALRCICSRGEIIPDDEEEDAEFFTEAIPMESPNATLAFGAEEDKTRAPQPQRWGSAASALYGGKAVPSGAALTDGEEDAFSGLKATPVNLFATDEEEDTPEKAAPATAEAATPEIPQTAAPAALPAESSAAPGEKKTSTETEAPIFKEKTPASEKKAAAPGVNPMIPEVKPVIPEAKSTASEAKPIIPEAPFAAPAPGVSAPPAVPTADFAPSAAVTNAADGIPSAVSSMERLDALIGRIDTSSRHASVDELLADLDTLASGRSAAAPSAEDAAGEKWVFRR